MPHWWTKIASTFLGGNVRKRKRDERCVALMSLVPQLSRPINGPQLIQIPVQTMAIYLFSGHENSQSYLTQNQKGLVGEQRDWRWKESVPLYTINVPKQNIISCGLCSSLFLSVFLFAFPFFFSTPIPPSFYVLSITHTYVHSQSFFLGD